MFGLGWGEMVVIGIVALIAIGPKELPTVLRTLGQWTGKVRRMANEFQGQFQEALREVELDDLKKHAEDISNSVSEFSNIDPLADVQKDVERELATIDSAPEVKPVEAPAAEATAPVAEVSPPPDGALLPAAVVPSAIEVPLPEPPAAVSNEDFAAAEPPPAKKAGSGA